MANVLFKKGLQSALPATRDEGTFYVTTDTCRLYLGEKLLSQAIRIYDSVTELVNPTDAEEKARLKGQFAYIMSSGGGENTHGGNILAVYDGTKWTQVNPDTDTDTKVSGNTYTVSAADGKVTVLNTIALVDKKNTSVGTKSDSFSIVGAGSVSVSANGKDITVTGKEYSLAQKTGDLATLTVSDGTTEKGAVKVVGGDNVTVTPTAGQISIAAKDTKLYQNGSSAAPVSSGTGFGITIAETENGTAQSGSVSVSINPIIKLGNNTPEYKFDGGIATLPVYTKEEIDAKHIAMNAMRYKGTVSSAAALTALNGSAEIGDTYKVTANFGTYKINDMIIANGTEDANGKLQTVSWDVIPGGAAASNQISYKAKATSDSGNAKFTIEEVIGNAASGTSIGGIAISAGDNLALEDVDSTGSTQTFTIKHSTAGTAASSITGSDVTVSAGGDVTFAALGSLSYDKNGHVVSVEEKTLTITGNKLTTGQATSSVTEGAAAAIDSDKKKAITLGGFLYAKDIAGTQSGGSISHELKSDTLVFSKSGDNGVQVDLVWGSF